MSARRLSVVRRSRRSARPVSVRVASSQRPHDHFVAREAALESLTDTLESGARWLTIIGPGGIGKTRLVLEHLATGESSAHAFVDAAPLGTEPLTTMDAVRDAVLGALGAIGEANTDAGVGAALLKRGPFRLFVDNVEQLGNTFAPSALAWLDIAPALQLVATSRTAPEVRGGRVLRLGELPPGPASVLFMRRAQEQGYTVREGAVLDRVLAHLDGVPLAIELAAARMDVLSLEDLAERLGDSLALLTSAECDRPSRHASLELAFRSSLDALDRRQLALLQRCSVFRGPFELRAAEAVAADPDVADGLRKLLACSLLVRGRDDHATGLRLLEPLRRLLPAPADETKRRHADHFLPRAQRLAADFDRQESVRALVEFVAIREDVAAAVAYAWQSGSATAAAEGALALALADTLRRCATAGLAHFDVSPTDVAQIDPSTLGRWHLRHAEMWCRVGSLDRAFAELEKLKLVDQATLPAQHISEARCIRGVFELLRGRFEEANAHLDVALATQRETGDRIGEGVTLGYLGRLARTRFELDRATDLFRAALEIHGECGSVRYHMQALTGLAHTLLSQGRFAEAREQYAELLVSSRTLSDDTMAGCALGELARIAHLERRDDEALTLYGRAVGALRRSGDRLLLPLYLSSLAMLEHMVGEPRRALGAAAEATRLSLQGSKESAALPFAIEGALAGAAGRARRGAELLEEATRLTATRDVSPHFAPTLDLLHACWRIETEDDTALGTAHAVHWETTRTPPSTMSHRLVFALFEHAIDRRGWSERFAEPPRDTLLVARDGSFFHVPGQDESVRLRGRPASKLLDLLARARRSHPQRFLTRGDLVASVWPGERILEKAALNRFNVALSQLRKAGLGPLLERRGDGYRLDPEVPMIFARSVPALG